MAAVFEPMLFLSFVSLDRRRRWWQFGWPYMLLSTAMFIIFSDFAIYFIHRGLHHPRIYKYGERAGGFFFLFFSFPLFKILCVVA